MAQAPSGYSQVLNVAGADYTDREADQRKGKQQCTPQLGRAPYNLAGPDFVLQRKKNELETHCERLAATITETTSLLDCFSHVQNVLSIDQETRNVIERISAVCKQAPGVLSRIISHVNGNAEEEDAISEALQDLDLLKTRLISLEAQYNADHDAAQQLHSEVTARLCADTDELLKARASEVAAKTAYENIVGEMERVVRDLSQAQVAAQSANEARDLALANVDELKLCLGRANDAAEAANVEIEDLKVSLHKAEITAAEGTAKVSAAASEEIMQLKASLRQANQEREAALHARVSADAQVERLKRRLDECEMAITRAVEESDALKGKLLNAEETAKSSDTRAQMAESARVSADAQVKRLERSLGECEVAKTRAVEESDALKGELLKAVETAKSSDTRAQKAESDRDDAIANLEYQHFVFPENILSTSQKEHFEEAMIMEQVLGTIDIECRAADWLTALPGLAKPAPEKRLCRQQMIWLLVQAHREDRVIVLDDIYTLVEGMTDDVETLRMVMGFLLIFIQCSARKLTNGSPLDVSAMVMLLRCVELFCRHLMGHDFMLEYMRDVLVQIRPAVEHLRSGSILIAGLAEWLEDMLQQVPAEQSWLAQKIAAHARSRGRSIRAGDREVLTDGDCVMILDNAACRNEPVYVFWPDSFEVQYRAAVLRLVVKNHPPLGNDLVLAWDFTAENGQLLYTMFEPAIIRLSQGQ